MGYELRAVIGSGPAVNQVAQALGSQKVALQLGMFMLPWTDELFDSLGADAPTDEIAAGLRYLHSGLVEALVEACELSPLAYVEVEFFGGIGAQGAAVFRECRLEWSAGTGPVNSRLGARTPVSQALHLIGVPAAASGDEFDTVGLGQHRHTDDWT